MPQFNVPAVLKHALVLRAVLLIVGLVFITSSWLLSHIGFSTWSESRQLVRLNTTTASAMVSGEYRIAGNIEPLASAASVSAPYSEMPVLWVEYHKSKRTRSGDKTRWRTVERGVRGVPHMSYRDAEGRLGTLVTGRLFSPEGRLIMSGQRDNETATWHLPVTHQTREGDYRYVERALTPDRHAFTATGVYDAQSDAFHLTSTPRMESHFTTGDLRQVVAQNTLIGVAQMAGVVLLLTLGSGFVLLALGVHRLWVFVSGISLLVALQLGLSGASQLRQDWQHTADIAMDRFLAVHELGDAARKEHIDDARTLVTHAAASAHGWIDRRFFSESIGDLSIFVDDSNLPELPANSLSLKGLESKMALVGTLIALWAGIAFLWTALKGIREKRLAEGIGWNLTGRLSYGLTKKRGAARPLESSLSGPENRDMLVFTSRIEERRGSGKKAEWVTLSSKREMPPFLIQGEGANETGAMVLPEGATIDFPHHLVEPLQARPKVQRRITSWIAPGDVLTVFAHAGVNGQAPSRLALQAEPNSPFLITSKGPKALLMRLAMRPLITLTVGFAAFLFGIAGLLAFFGGLTPGRLTWVVGAMPLFLLTATIMLHYNDLVWLRLAVTTRRQHVMTQLKKRADLIPSLESVATQYMAHEKGLHDMLAQLRASPLPDRIDSEMDAVISAQGKAVDTLSRKAEDYPELAASGVMEQLQEIAAETENHLAFLRDGYLQSIEIYNTRARSFPDVILAKAFGFKPETNTLNV